MYPCAVGVGELIVCQHNMRIRGKNKPNFPIFPGGRNLVFGCEKSVMLGSMSNHIYKKIELVGSSPNSIEEAVQNAIAKASLSLRNLRWFEVIETRGQIEDGRVAHWQVTVKVGFTLES